MQNLNKKIKISLIFHRCKFTGKNEKILKLFSKKATDEPIEIFISVCKNDLKFSIKECLEKSNLIFIIGEDHKKRQEIILNVLENNKLNDIKTEALKFELFKISKIISNSHILFLFPDKTEQIEEALNSFVRSFIIRELIIKRKLMKKTGFKIKKRVFKNVLNLKI